MDAEPAGATDATDAQETRRRLVATVYRRRPGVSVSELRLLVERLGVTATSSDLVADARSLGLSVGLGADDLLRLSGTITEEPSGATEPAPVVVSVAEAEGDGLQPVADPGQLVAVMIGVLVLIAVVGLLLGSSY